MQGCNSSARVGHKAQKCTARRNHSPSRHRFRRVFPSRRPPRSAPVPQSEKIHPHPNSTTATADNRLYVAQYHPLFPLAERNCKCSQFVGYLYLPRVDHGGLSGLPPGAEMNSHRGFPGQRATHGN